MFPLATLILFACALLPQLGYSSTLSSNNNLVYQLFTSTKNVDYLLPSDTIMFFFVPPSATFFLPVLTCHNIFLVPAPCLLPQ